MSKHKQNTFICFYCLMFYAVMLYKWLNGLLLYQLDPAFIYTRQDLTSWFMMQSGLPNFFIDNTIACVIADLVFLLLPALLLFLNTRHSKAFIFTGYVMLLYNFFYVQILTLYPSYSIEVLTGWILFPCLFIAGNERINSIIIHALRYMICYIMLSAAIWKLAQGGIFYEKQMSNILIQQHADILVQQSKNSWSDIYNWLIGHPAFAQAIYIAAAFMEAFFAIGFITHRYDKVLRYCLVIFIAADFLLMRIAYFDYLIFLLVLPLKAFTSASRKFTLNPAI